MTQKAPTQKDLYIESFESFERNGFSRDPSWVQTLRKDAISRFAELGFPTTRRGNEEWKYTDIGPIAKVPFQTPLKPVQVSLAKEDMERFTLGESDWTRMVFVDGRLKDELSISSLLPPDVSVLSMADAMLTKPELMEKHLAKYKSYDRNAFVALNTAFIQDGAFIHIPDGTIVDKPIHIIYIATAAEPDMVSYPRTLVVAGRDSKADIIESYWTLSDDRYFTNAVTEIVVEEGASIKYHKMEFQGESAFHITNTQVVQKRDSHFTSINIDIGGRLVRNNIDLLTAEENTNCLINGLYLITGLQHVDNQVILDHAKPYTTSRELYKGVLGGKSRSVFHGSIIVRPGAVKVNANQVDKNLLLSNKAEADTKPAFWIYCDDVRCGHGAACGQMDEDSLFYLRSRGLDEETARVFLTRGFVNEIIESIDNEAIRGHVDELVKDKLSRIKWSPKE